jgi:hypothetical protein
VVEKDLSISVARIIDFPPHASIHTFDSDHSSFVGDPRNKVSYFFFVLSFCKH